MTPKKEEISLRGRTVDLAESIGALEIINQVVIGDKTFLHASHSDEPGPGKVFCEWLIQEGCEPQFLG